MLDLMAAPSSVSSAVIVFHGASGHTGSSTYDNQNATWAAGKMVPMLYAWDKIEASSTSHQQLLPVVIAKDRLRKMIAA